MTSRLPRRSLLALPGLALCPRGAAAGPDIPPFAAWIGRTALLRGDAGAVRLLLAEGGTGLCVIRVLFVCRVLPVLGWRIGPDGLVLHYSRVSAIDARRVIPGEARILPDQSQVLLVEAAQHLADFDGFAPAELATRCS
jgi:hypothetical protein